MKFPYELYDCLRIIDTSDLIRMFGAINKEIERRNIIFHREQANKNKKRRVRRIRW